MWILRSCCGQMLQVAWFCPGYKPRQRSKGTNNLASPSNQANCAVVGMISEQIHSPGQAQNEVGSFVQTLNHVQYRQLVSMLNNHLNVAKADMKHETGYDQRQVLVFQSQSTHNLIHLRLGWLIQVPQVTFVQIKMHLTH